MDNQSYLFIDGGHLRHHYKEAINRWCGQDGELDIGRLNQNLGASKCFFYDCVDDITKAGETQADFEKRVAAQEAWFEKVQRTPGTHVRLGSMTGTRRNKRQKQVDILLAVDMMNHAFRRNMSLAMLVSGDQDFKPLVQSMVDMGLHVHVLGDHRHTSPDLAAAADLYRPLTIRDYLEWSPESFRTAFPVPGKHISNPGLETYKKLKDVTIGGQLGELFHDGTTYLARYPADGLFMVLTSHDEQRLRLYCEMDFGQVVW